MHGCVSLFFSVFVFLLLLMSVFNFCPFFDFAKDNHQPSIVNSPPSNLNHQTCIYMPFSSVKMNHKIEKNTAICHCNICMAYIMKKIWQKNVKKMCFWCMLLKISVIL